MRYISFIILFTFMFFNTQAQDYKLKKTKIAKVLTVELPENFKLLSDDEMASKYTTLTRPLAVYSDTRNGADFSVISKPSHFAAEDLPLMKEFYKSSIQSNFTEVRFLTEKIEEINGQDFVVFEFVSSVKDEGNSVRKLAAANYYTLILYTIKNNKLYISTFSVPLQYQAKWQKTANEVMRTIKFKD